MSIWNPLTLSIDWAPRDKEDGNGGGAGASADGGTDGAGGSKGSPGSGADEDEAKKADGGTGKPEGAEDAENDDSGKKLDPEAEDARLAELNALKEKAEKFDAIEARRLEKPGDYNLGDVSAFLPDGFELHMLDDTPLVRKARELAHKYAMEPEDFATLGRTFFETQAEMLRPSIEAELKQLGDRGKERMQRASSWAGKHVPDEFGDLAKALSETARGVRFVEWLQRNAGRSLGSETAEGLSVEQLERQLAELSTQYDKMPSSRYQERMALQKKRFELRERISKAKAQQGAA